VQFIITTRRVKRMHRALKDVPSARYATEGTTLGFTAELGVQRHRMHEWLREATAGLPVCKMLGPPFEASQVWLIAHDPACIRHFLKDSFDNYTKPSPDQNPFFHFFHRWVGDGIFTFRHGKGAPDEGHAWHIQRKIAAGIFSRANFQNNMGEVFSEKAGRMVRGLEAAAKSGEAVDLQAMFFCFTMDSILQIFFGEAANTLEGEPCVYGAAFDTAHRCMMNYSRPCIKTLTMLKHAPWPFGGVGGLFWRIHGMLHPDFCEFRKACGTLTSESERLVAACRADPKLGERRDLLALFTQAEEKQHFTADYLRDMVLNFVIAGRDTTACLLSWMFYVLSVNPEVQDEILAEVDARCPAGTAPSLKLLAPGSMPYLQGVLYETLRLYPPVPSDSKQAYADDVWPDGTFVPKGTVCMWLPYTLGRDPAVYPEPEVVRPERWIPFVAPAPHEFPVFQAGPRICLGMDMAIFEAKVAAVSLLQRYRFELKPGEREKITYSNTLTMSVCNSPTQDSHNLWLIPHARS